MNKQKAAPPTTEHCEICGPQYEPVPSITVPGPKGPTVICCVCAKLFGYTEVKRGR